MYYILNKQESRVKMSKTDTGKIPRIAKTVREENLVEDSIEIIRIIRPKWIEEKAKNGVEIKSKVHIAFLLYYMFAI